MKTLTKEEVSKALAEAIVKAMENTNHYIGDTREHYIVSDFESVYGYAVKAKKKTTLIRKYEQNAVFELYKCDGKYHNKITSVSIEITHWRKMEKLGVYDRVAPVVDFFMTFIGKIEVEEDNNEVEYVED